MESKTGSKITETNDDHNEQDTISYLRPSFLNHRGSNNSLSTEENSVLFNSYILNSDSGYNSSCINTPNVSESAVITPQKSSNHSQHHNSNLNTIPESPDPTIKLTPVTQNIRKIFNIHITTPKSQDLPIITTKPDSNFTTENDSSASTSEKREEGNTVKRSAITELVFDDYQNTPKKKAKIDYSLESRKKVLSARNISSTAITPLRRGRRLTRSHNKLCKEKLHSAPNLDLNFFDDDNVENISSVDSVLCNSNSSQFTPIRTPYTLQDKRTPLSSTSSNLIQASTPKYDNSNRRSSLSILDKSASVRKLLSFSDKEFEALLSSSSESQVPKKSLETKDAHQFETIKKQAVNSCKQIKTSYLLDKSEDKRPLRRSLKFACKTPLLTDESKKKITKIKISSPLSLSLDSDRFNHHANSDNDGLKDYKKLYPLMNDVVQDRRILKRQRSSSTARFIDIKRESQSLTRLNRNSNESKKFRYSESTIKQNEIEKENNETKKGFQEILGYIPSSYDLKISSTTDKSDKENNNNDDDDNTKLKNIESLRDFNLKLLRNDDTQRLDSDLDVSKESLKSTESKMSIDDTNRTRYYQSGGECDMDISLNLATNVKNKTLILNSDLDVSQNLSELQDNIVPIENVDNVDIPDFSDIRFENEVLTPPKKQRSLSPCCDDDDNVLKVNFSETDKFLPTTPKKAKQQNNYYTTVDYEKNELLYPTIPRTPSKKCISKSSSFSSVSSVKYKYAPITLKRKPSIISDKKKRSKIFYNGCTYLNIIAKLESYNLVLDRIFDMLSSHDLLNLTLTSVNLRNVVLFNQKAKQRITEYMKERQKMKENDFELIEKHLTEKLHQQQQPSTSCNQKYSSVLKTKQLSVDNIKIVPFKNSNDRRQSVTTTVIQRSPPVSPSKRKFHENQKVVKLLNENEKLIKCPRCSRSSRIIDVFPSTLSSRFFETDLSNNNDRHHNIINVQNNESQVSYTKNTFPFSSATSTSINLNNNNNNDFTAISNSQPISSSSSSSQLRSIKPKFVKSMSVDSVIFSPSFTLIKKQQSNLNSNSTYASNNNNCSTNLKRYGECTGLVCRFRFCLDCLCEYHPSSPCKIRTTLNNSPTKEDIQNGILQINTSSTATSSSSATNSRSLKIRRKSLKRLCF